MTALATIRTTPARLAARLQSAKAGDEGMTTAEYAVGTEVVLSHVYRGSSRGHSA